MNTQPVSYLQTDPKWKNIPYAVSGESATIGGSGCGPTSMAMVLATWADNRVTPKTECAWALAHGYKAKAHGTYYSYFVPAAKRYGLSCTQLNGASIEGNAGSGLHAQVKSFLSQGDLIIACMGKGNWTKSGHFVVLWDVQGDVAYINDPASTAVKRTHGSWALFRQQVKFYWRIRRPSNIPIKEDEPEMTAQEIRQIAEETAKVTAANVAKETMEKAKADINLALEPFWSISEGWWQKAIRAGIVDGSDPERYAKRDEVIAILGRLGLLESDHDRTQRALDSGMD